MLGTNYEKPTKLHTKMKYKAIAILKGRVFFFIDVPFDRRLGTLKKCFYIVVYTTTVCSLATNNDAMYVLFAWFLEGPNAVSMQTRQIGLEKKVHLYLVFGNTVVSVDTTTFGNSSLDKQG